MTQPDPDVWIECTDFARRQVYLTRTVAEHIRRRHPEMIPFLERICDVLEQPDLVYERTRVNSTLFYKLEVLTGRLANTYMVAVVRYNEEVGQIRTVYPTTSPASGDSLLHVRPRRGR